MAITPLMPVYPRSEVRPVRGEGVYLYGEKGERYRRDLAFMRATDDELRLASDRIRTGASGATPDTRSSVVLDEIRRFRDA